MGRKKLGLGPSFSCRLTEQQDAELRAEAGGGVLGMAQTLRRWLKDLAWYRHHFGPVPEPVAPGAPTPVEVVQ